MSTTLNLKKILHRPQWELINPIPAANAAGSFIRSLYQPTYNINHHFFAVNTTSAVYHWTPVADSEALLPASGIAGTFGAGSCGKVHPMGPTGTASAGTTTTLTTTLTMLTDCRGYRIRITAGPGAGDERIIASNTIGANSIITVSSAFSSSITSSSVYQLITPRLWVFNPAATPGLGYWDHALGAWTAGKSVAGVTFTGTDGLLNATPSIIGNTTDAADIGVWLNNSPGVYGNPTAVFGSATTSLFTLASGRNWTTNAWAGSIVTIVAGTGVGQTRIISANTALTFTVSATWSVTPDATSVWQITKGFASSGGLSTFASTTTSILTVTGTAWATNQWANTQIRFIAGTGAGQIRTISANTGTTLTVSAVWSTSPDSTTIWIIEGNDDTLYLMGNAAVALFKYSISANTWATATATAARAGAPGAGLSSNWITGISDPVWNNENANLNGRYLYSFRGGATNTLDYYDLSATTWVSNRLYAYQGETFTTGCCYEYDGLDYIFIAQAATGRFFYYDVLLNLLKPAGEHNFPQSTAIVGDKLFGISYIDAYSSAGPSSLNGCVRLFILYHWCNTSQTLMRCIMWHLY